MATVHTGKVGHQIQNLWAKSWAYLPDPYQHMGALGDEMHRAVRLVVDVAMHEKKMTREQAIKYMMDNEAISEQGATAEIEDILAIPGRR